MARVSDDTKVLCAKRLNQVIRETGILRKELAEICGVSPAYVSSMAPKKPDEVSPKDIAAISRSSARRINARYPDYSIEWLMGESAYQNERQREIEEQKAKSEERDMSSFAFELLASLNGYTRTSAVLLEPSGETLHFEVEDEWDTQKIIDAEKLVDAQIIQKDGKTVTISQERFDAIRREVSDFVDFKLGRLFKERG